MTAKPCDLMAPTIVPTRRDLIHGYRAAVEAVAAERVHLGRITLPPFDPENPFPLRLIANDWPTYCAIDGDVVAGWADIVPSDIPECRHRGTLGMGLLADYRGQGLGRELLAACLLHAPRAGIETVELTVYTSNVAAIAVYKRFQFVEYGRIRDYRRVDGVSYDAVLMSKAV
jgi:ribosomal protein S18 acetylase RimI-like enzyme